MPTIWRNVNKQTIFVFYPWTGGTNTSGLTSFLENNVDSICEGLVAKKGLNNSRVMVFISQNYRKSYLIDLQYDGNTKTVIRDTLKTYDEATYTTAEGFAEILNEVKQLISFFMEDIQQFRLDMQDLRLFYGWCL